jgi:1,4-dihydroxy-2-naphthoyl-CoA hydrolase
MSESTSFLHTAMPLTATLGFEVDEYAADEVVLAVDVADALCTSGGALHGGAVMALADSAGGACAFLNLPDGAVGTSTIQSATNFVGAVREGRVTATARPVHLGRTTIVVETEIRNGDRLVAKTIQTQTVLRPT